MSTNQVALRLNAKAMDRLFPEGTDLRVDLQNAVLAEVSKKYVKSALTQNLQNELMELVSLPKLNDQLESLIQHYADRGQIKTEMTPIPGTNPGSWTKDRFAEFLEKIVHSRITKQISEKIDEKIDEALETRLSQLDELVERRVNSKINEEIRVRVQARWNRMLDAV